MKRFLAMACLWAAAPAACSVPATAPGGGPGSNPKSALLYSQDAVVEVSLTFTEQEWLQFLANWQGKTKEYVHCSLAFNGGTFGDAACRPKGNRGDWGSEKKPQFVVRFNYWDRTGRFLGLRGLNLEANTSYLFPMRDRLGMWVMREDGIDAPRVNHARVFVNGNYIGLYENIERIDREFLEDHFADPSGNLYEQGTTLTTNEAVGDTSDLETLNGLVSSEPMDGDHAAFYAQLEKLVDVHEVLHEMAVETVLPTFDNISNGSWNYYYYHVPGKGFVVIPWDLDDSMSPSAPARADIWEFLGHAPAPNRMRQLMNQNPAYRAEFLDRLVAVRDGAYSELPARVDEWCAQVRQAFADEPASAGSLADFDGACQDLKRRIADRVAFLKEVIGR